MKVKESILQEIGNYIDGRIDELSELAKKYAEIDNYAEIARLKEMKRVQKMMEKLINRTCEEGAAAMVAPILFIEILSIVVYTLV